LPAASEQLHANTADGTESALASMVVIIKSRKVGPVVDFVIDL
jgi:hypothetical protein